MPFTGNVFWCHGSMSFMLLVVTSCLGVCELKGRSPFPDFKEWESSSLAVVPAPAGGMCGGPGVALVPGVGRTRSRAQVCVPRRCIQGAGTTTFPTMDVQLPLPRVSHRKHVVVDPWSRASMNLKNCPVPASVSTTGVLFKAS